MNGSVKQALRVVCGVVLGSLFTAAMARGQVPTDGSIRGHVKDQQGGVLAGVTVTATAPGAPKAVTTVSDRAGSYQLEPLQAGTYRVTAQAAGFAPYVRENIEIRAGVPVNLEIEMAVGGLTEAVRVTASTGTSILGVAPVGAPTIAVTRETLEDRGYTDLGEAMRALPQMSTLGATPGAQLAVGDQASNLNYGKGASVNLRGLGADATLVLLNGRRIASSGTGTFVDVSEIPLMGVERVEIVTDGTSAIYGSDAVAGVVNILSPRSIRGVKLEGDLMGADSFGTRRAALASGYDWGSGGVALSAEFRHSDQLNAPDRAFYGADQRPYGGADLRTTFCSPGNVTAQGVTYALPAGTGVGLTPAQLTPGTSNRCDIQLSRSLYPRSNAYSGMLHATQGLGNRLSLFADVLYSQRESRLLQGEAVSNLTVPSSNPWFIPFTGTAPLTSVSVQYNFVNDIGQAYNIAKASNRTAITGIDYDFASDWRASVFYGFSRTTATSESYNDLNTFYINQALASSDPATAFNPFGSGGTLSAAMADSFRGYSLRPTRVLQHQVQGIVDGSLGDLLRLGAGDVKIAMGAEWIDEDYLETNRRLSNTAAEVPGNGSSGHRSNKAVFAETSIPFLARNTSTVLRSATLGAAVRADNYDDFGTAVNPRLGLDIEAFPGWHLRTSWGHSFKAPLLFQLSPVFTASVSTLADPLSPTGSTVVLQTSRRETPLNAQTSENRSVSISYAQPDRPFTVSAGYYRIAYTDRITSLSAATILGDQTAYANFVRRDPTTADIDAIRNDPNISAPLTTVPPTGVGAIVFSGNRNVAKLDTSGFDLAGSYHWNMNAGRFSLAASLSRIFNYETQAAAGLPVVDSVGLITFPNKGRATGDLAFENDGFRVFVGGNFLNSYINTRVNPRQDIPSYVTFSAGLRVKLDNLLEGVPEGTSLQVSAYNLADRKPPFVLGLFTGYDGSAHDPIGRQVTVSLRTGF